MNKEEYKELHKFLAVYKWHLIDTLNDQNLDIGMSCVLESRLHNIDDLINSMPVNLPPKNYMTVNCYEAKEDKQ